MKRRSFLQAMPLAGIATALPALAEATPISAEARVDKAIEELKAAVAEVYPDVDTWNIAKGSKGVPIMVMGFTPLGKEMDEPFRRPVEDSAIRVGKVRAP